MSLALIVARLCKFLNMLEQWMLPSWQVWSDIDVKLCFDGAFVSNCDFNESLPLVSPQKSIERFLAFHPAFHTASKKNSSKIPK
jgi:hypothetical protein